MGYISNGAGMLRMHSKFNPVFYRLVKTVGHTSAGQKVLSIVKAGNRKIHAGKFFKGDQKVQ